MAHHVRTVIIGQGIAGSTVAWAAYWRGHSLAIIDRNDRATASKVAAGLVTPATGKRLVRSSDYDDQWSTMCDFYRRVECEVGLPLLATGSILRTFADAPARQAFFDRSDAVESVDPWEGRLQTGCATHLGIAMKPAGRLDVPAYLAATQKFFRERASYHLADVDPATECELHADKVTLERLDLTADTVVVCTGAAATSLFPAVPNNPARGDILRVRIPNYSRPEVVHRSIWIAPNDDGTQSVGATYDWKNLSSKPSAEGRADLLSKLGRLVRGPISVEDHAAAVRPTMKDYRPVIGRHPEQPRIYILNGLGSKGTLRAPAMANDLLSIIEGTAQPGSDVAYDRLVNASNPPTRSRPLTSAAQDLVGEVVQQGETVIDATVGNGFDTCFLAEAVSASGHVIGFDIQSAAIDATSRRLKAAGFENVELRLESHEAISSLASGSVAAVMFNLGFLPRSDRTVVTQPSSSVVAIREATRVLRVGGLVTVLCYRGHEGGVEEYEAVRHVVDALGDRFDREVMESNPPKPTSPVLLVIRRTGQ